MLIKSAADIKKIKENGERMGEILSELAFLSVPGISAWEIDRLAEEKIRAVGGKPVFKGYRSRPSDTPYPATICASLNEELVHAIPTKKKILKDGDIFSIDIGMEYKGTVSDTAITLVVGDKNKCAPEVRRLLRITREALEMGISAAKPGNTVASIGKAVETYVSAQGNYGIVEALVGHGVGHELHEDPHIPNYYDPKLEKIPLQVGMVIAIEPMISIHSDPNIALASDGWTILMKNRAMCAHFEHSIIITKNGPVVATRRPNEDSEIFF